MAYHQKTRTQSAAQDVEKETSVHYWQERKLVQHYGQQKKGSSKKLHRQLSHDPVISLVDIYLKEMKTLI